MNQSETSDIALHLSNIQHLAIKSILLQRYYMFRASHGTYIYKTNETESFSDVRSHKVKKLILTQTDACM